MLIYSIYSRFVLKHVFKYLFFSSSSLWLQQFQSICSCLRKIIPLTLQKDFVKLYCFQDFLTLYIATDIIATRSSLTHFPFHNFSHAICFINIFKINHISVNTKKPMLKLHFYPKWINHIRTTKEYCKKEETCQYHPHHINCTLTKLIITLLFQYRSSCISF